MDDTNIGVYSCFVDTYSQQRVLAYIFLVQYNADAHNMHAHSPLWTHVHKSYPYEHLRMTGLADLDFAYHLMHNAEKS